MSNDAGLSTNPVCSFSGLPNTPQPLLRVKALPDAAYTFTQADSGCLFTLGALTAGRTYTLPPVAQSAGMHIRVVVSALPTQTATFQAPVGLMAGQIVSAVSAADPGVPTIANVGNVAKRSVATGANISVGASAEFVCDGVFWRANALGGSANGAAVWAFA